MNGLDFPRVGVLPSGQLDAITDVGDIRVGHCTLDEGNVHTGVTVVGNRHGADPCGGVRASGSRPGVVDGQPAGS